MDHFAGLDVSVKETSICVVDDAGKIINYRPLSALSVELEEMPLRADGLFIKGKHPSPEMRAKISAGLRRHWLQRERSASIAPPRRRGGAKSRGGAQAACV